MGAIKPRTCCQTHGDVCGFGRDHVWSGPFLLDGGRTTEHGVWSKPGDLKCANCGGVCIADREPVTAPDMESLIAAALVEHARMPYGHARGHRCACGGWNSLGGYDETHAAHQARAVLAAIRKAGAVEWAVQDALQQHPPGPASSDESDVDEMNEQIAIAATAGFEAVLVTRITGPWTEVAS